MVSGREDVVRLTSVSRETLARVHSYLRVLDAWRDRINLIGPGEGRHLWRRHVLDSACSCLKADFRRSDLENS